MRYSGDPRWIDARFDQICSRCGRLISRGDRTFYFPNGRTSAYCERDECGGKESRDFNAASFDEDYA